MQINPMVNDSETYTLTPATISLKRCGKICFITLRNYATGTAISTDTKICDLPISANSQIFGVGKTLGNVDVFLFVSNNGLYVSGITGLPAGTPTYGTLVFAID